jgi:hypothetical protein
LVLVLLQLLLQSVLNFQWSQTLSSGYVQHKHRWNRKRRKLNQLSNQQRWHVLRFCWTRWQSRMKYCKEGSAISKVKMFNNPTFNLTNCIRTTLDKASVLIFYRLETFNPLLIFFISPINAFPTSWKRKITLANAFIFLSTPIIIQSTSRRLINSSVLFRFRKFIGQDWSASRLSTRAKIASNERVQLHCL